LAEKGALAVRILLVEDDPRIANFVAKGLREQAYAVDVAANGEELQAWTNPDGGFSTCGSSAKER